MSRSSRLQMRRSDQEPQFGTKWTCSRCMITYYQAVSDDRPECPLCLLLREYQEERRALARAQQEISALKDEVRRLSVNVSYLDSIQSASELLDQNDRAFIKSVMYRWREKKNLILKPVHVKNTPRGFCAQWRDGSIETHMATSIGGVALAGILQEVTQAFGSSVALTTFAKGLSSELRGGTA